MGCLWKWTGWDYRRLPQIPLLSSSLWIKSVYTISNHPSVLALTTKGTLQWSVYHENSHTSSLKTDPCVNSTKAVPHEEITRQQPPNYVLMQGDRQKDSTVQRPKAKKRKMCPSNAVLLILWWVVVACCWKHHHLLLYQPHSLPNSRRRRGTRRSSCRVLYVVLSLWVASEKVEWGEDWGTEWQMVNGNGAWFIIFRKRYTIATAAAAAPRRCYRRMGWQWMGAF